MSRLHDRYTEAQIIALERNGFDEGNASSRAAIIRDEFQRDLVETDPTELAGLLESAVTGVHSEDRVSPWFTTPDVPRRNR
jgi:hypothetical protein